MPKNAACLKIPKKMGEKAIAEAAKLGLIDKTLQIQHDAETLCLPLLRQPEKAELAALKKEIVPPKLLGDKDYKALIVSWGSNLNIISEALARLNKKGLACLHFCSSAPALR